MTSTEYDAQRETAIANDVSFNDIERGDDDASSFGEEEISIDETAATGRTEKGIVQRKFKSRIFLSKLLFLIVLIASAAVTSALVYRFASIQETDEFEQQFTNQAKEMIKAIGGSVASSFSALESFSNLVTSISLLDSNDWPLVTIPHYEVAGSDYIATTSATFVALAPLVAEGDRFQWEAFSADSKKWIQDGIVHQNLQQQQNEKEAEPPSIPPFVWVQGFRQGEAIRDPASGPYLPLWQQYPPPNSRNAINFNLMSSENFRSTIETAIYSQTGVLSQVLGQESILSSNRDPTSVLFQPVYPDFNKTNSVAFLVSLLPWDVHLQGTLFDKSFPVYSVLKSSCPNKEEIAFTYQMDGAKAEYIGANDLHNSDFDSLEVSANFDIMHGLVSTCKYSIHIYPSDEMRDHFQTSPPASMLISVFLTLILTSLAFMVYDIFVQRKTRKVVKAANKTNQIIHNLFPAQVHDRLFNADTSYSNSNHSNSSSPKRRRRKREFGQSMPKLDESKTATETTDSDNCCENQNKLSKPIADLFPNCTVMFCDIAGFTAWSSVREPFMVFQLLETVYNAFDDIARRRKVFKVETIGDCYLAVAGLPTPRKDHAVVMTRFASDCMTQFDCLAQELEIDLGPGTSDLAMRFGLHSGPVTAGVLRGEKTRFQLFGDTVNTASRMESTGEKKRIQISAATANLLNEAHKGHWCERRKEPVVAKGKGEMITYFCDPKAGAGSLASFSTSSREMEGPKNPDEAYSNSSHTDVEDEEEQTSKSPISKVDLMQESFREMEQDTICPKLQRSISFVSGVLLSLLRQIVARRMAMGQTAFGQTQATRQARMTMLPEPGALVLDELKEIISLPSPPAARRVIDPESVELPIEVVQQLHSLVTVLALMYQDNPFHNFIRAANTVLSASKLLSRIASPDDSTSDDDWSEKRRAFGSKLNDNSCGVFSDPLTQFSIIFGTLIKDCDHPGVPNSVLVNNETPIAQHYQNKSVAEQNSVDVAWEVLCDDSYSDLCACIFANEIELHRFRQLLVNSVLATDIADPQLNRLREMRWDRAFCITKEESKPGQVQYVSVKDDANRRATIVIEHLMQAADLCHFMQHWDEFLKWNEKKFAELYTAFLAGHLEKDPSKNWYQNELGFFDQFIIPLANKLVECGVFGASSTEYLYNSLENRHIFENMGPDIVDGYLRKYRPMKDHFVDDFKEKEESMQEQKMGACRDLQRKDDACSIASTSSHRMARPVDDLFNYSYHARRSPAPPLA